MYDRLTGVWNRAAIMDGLHQELDRAARDNTMVGVILADLDHFKAVNDTYGHLAGDAVLQEAARRMRAALRSYDKVGRYGGEEFLIVVPDSTLMNIAALAERIRACISATPVETTAGTLSITSSLGVAANRIGASEDANALIAAADTALYRAKNGGRNRVETAHVA